VLSPVQHTGPGGCGEVTPDGCTRNTSHDAFGRLSVLLALMGARYRRKDTLMRIKTAIGISIAGLAAGAAIGGTAYATTGGGAAPAEPATPVVSEERTSGTLGGTNWDDCPEKAPGAGSAEAPAPATDL
jgi:hypothetical protein